MFRFTIKAMLYATAIAAAVALVAREAKHGPTKAGLTGYLVYISLMLWIAFSQHKSRAKKAMMPQEGGAEKHGE